MKKQYDYDYLIFIGRFQPYHRAHQHVVEIAYEHANNIILLLGSAHSPRTTANPWSVKEREEMIRSLYDDAHNQRMMIRGITDFPYDDEQWRQNVINTVHTLVKPQAKIGIIGHIKDSSSYYLNLFPNWGLMSVENLDQINATDIRRYYFTLPKSAHLCHDDLHPKIAATLETFRQSEDYAQLRAEQDYLQQWRQAWQTAPYPPIFVTVDACVVCCEHILMVKRKGPLGAGLWALPGGFIEQQENLADGALRELKEETGLDCPARYIDRVTVFAKPDRSARGRTITHVHRITLPEKTLPSVSGADDAAEAAWFPLATLEREKCFEDHYSIIRQLT